MRGPKARAEAGPAECAGRSLEAAGNGGPRWMIAPPSEEDRTRLTGQPVRSRPVTCGFTVFQANWSAHSPQEKTPTVAGNRHCRPPDPPRHSRPPRPAPRAEVLPADRAGPDAPQSPLRRGLGLPRPYAQHPGQAHHRGRHRPHRNRQLDRQRGHHPRPRKSPRRLHRPGSPAGPATTRPSTSPWVARTPTPATNLPAHNVPAPTSTRPGRRRAHPVA